MLCICKNEKSKNFNISDDLFFNFVNKLLGQ